MRMDSVNSTTFIKRPPLMTDVQEKFLYTKELLSGRIFLGSYQERRFVAVLNEYRDVVVLHPEETDLEHDLDRLRKKWTGVTDINWVGITGPDDSSYSNAYCFWVKLRNLAFGHYWFQIKHVKLVDQTVTFQLKCIRKSQAPLISDTPQIIGKQSDGKNKKSEASTSQYLSGADTELDPQKIIKSFQTTCREAIHSLRPFIILRNILTIIKVTCAVIITLVMGVISFIGHMEEFFLKLTREFSLLVYVLTPIFIQLIDLLSKVIGGFYILLARVIIGNDNHPNPRRNSNSCSIPYSNEPISSPRTPALDWRERNQVLRQELFNNSIKKDFLRVPPAEGKLND